MSISLYPLPGTTRDPLYPDSDGKPMGETEYHILAIIHLYDVLRPWFRPQGVHVAADMLLYYEEGHPSAVRGPDVMVTKGVRGTHLRRSFRTWEEGVVPAVIIEVTSVSTKDEDQFVKPAVYASIGVKEYLLFDPVGEYLHPRLQGFQLVGGRYVPMMREQTDWLSSPELGLDLAIDAHLLRVIDPATGARLPTREKYQEQVKRSLQVARKAKREAADTRRAAAEAEQAAAEAEQAAAKAEQAAAKAQRAAAKAQRDVEVERRRAAQLEAENARLRALLPPEQDRGDA